jgi:hypothetical protein
MRTRTETQLSIILTVFEKIVALAARDALTLRSAGSTVHSTRYAVEASCVEIEPVQARAGPFDQMTAVGTDLGDIKAGIEIPAFDNPTVGH